MPIRQLAKLIPAMALGALSCAAPVAPLGEGDGEKFYSTDLDPAEVCPDGEVHLRRSGSTRTVPAWTVMHFAAADNNLEDALLDDIAEMEQGFGGRVTDNVNVIVQLDKESEDGMWRYRVGPHRVPGEDEPQPGPRLLSHTDEEPDSGDSQTLVDFAEWAITCYPAENYMVIIGGHGGGWSTSPDGRGGDGSLRARMSQRFHVQRTRRTHGGPGRGTLPSDRMPSVDRRRAATGGSTHRVIAPDDESGNEMYVDELADALETIRDMTRRPAGTVNGGEVILENREHNRLVAYGSDACLMGTAEVAWDLRNGPRYVIGSSETEPGAGWPYSTVIRYLVDNSNVTIDDTDEFMESLLDKYQDSYSIGGVESIDDNVTLSAVNTRWIEQSKNNLARIVEILMDRMAADESLRDIVAQAYSQFPSTTIRRMGLDEDVIPSLDVVEAIAREEREADVQWQSAYSWGDGYRDLGLFLVSLRYLLYVHDFVPVARAHGDETMRELRDKLNDLLENDGKKLVVGRAMGKGFEHALGLSVYMADNQCGYGYDPDGYAESSFNEATQWLSFVQAITAAGVNEPQEPDEAYGYGHMEYEATVKLEGTDVFTPLHESLTEPFYAYTECELYDGTLYLYAEGYDDCQEIEVDGQTECMYPPDLSIDIDTASRTVSRYYAWSSDDELDMDYEAWDVSEPIEVDEWQPGTYYTGVVTLEFPRREGSGDTIRMRVDFECDEFEVYGGGSCY